MRSILKEILHLFPSLDLEEGSLKNEQSGEPYAKIHHFFTHPVTGENDYDDNGDPLIGYYFQLMKDPDTPITEIIGPYITDDSCAEAAQLEYDSL